MKKILFLVIMATSVAMSATVVIKTLTTNGKPISAKVSLTAGSIHGDTFTNNNGISRVGNVLNGNVNFKIVKPTKTPCKYGWKYAKRSNTINTCKICCITLTISCNPKPKPVTPAKPVKPAKPVTPTKPVKPAKPVNGKDGVNGLNSLIKQIIDSNKCVITYSGLDKNRNNVLDANEITGTAKLCPMVINGTNGTNGTDGYTTLFKRNMDSKNCVTTYYGLDKNRNNTLDSSEVQGSDKVCPVNGKDGTNGIDGTDGFNSLIKKTVDNNKCVITYYGLDKNRNNTLDSSEIQGSDKVCPIKGTNGTDGKDGTDGYTTLFKRHMDSKHCVTTYYGLDKNRNNVLDTNEIQGSDKVCPINGTKGTDGKDGKDGTDAINIIQVSEDANNTQCKNGGTFVKYGKDDNNNTELEDEEVDGDYTICNGDDGEDGVATLTVAREANTTECKHGGTILDIFKDKNDNGVIDNNESIQQTKLCNVVIEHNTTTHEVIEHNTTTHEIVDNGTGTTHEVVKPATTHQTTYCPEVKPATTVCYGTIVNGVCCITKIETIKQTEEESPVEVLPEETNSTDNNNSCHCDNVKSDKSGASLWIGLIIVLITIALVAKEEENTYGNKQANKSI